MCAEVRDWVNIAEAESDVYNAAAEYDSQCIWVDRLKDGQKSTFVEFLQMKDVFVISLPTSIRSCTILLGLFGLYEASMCCRQQSEESHIINQSINQSINQINLCPSAKYIKKCSTALKLTTTAGTHFWKGDSSRVSWTVQKYYLWCDQAVCSTI